MAKEGQDPTWKSAAEMVNRSWGLQQVAWNEASASELRLPSCWGRPCKAVGGSPEQLARRGTVNRRRKMVAAGPGDSVAIGLRQEGEAICGCFGLCAISK
jgi:hypothetical protein